MTEAEKAPSRAVKLRVNVAGHAGDAVSLFCAFDPANEVLIVAVANPYEAGQREGFLRVTTQEQDECFDAVFLEEDMRDAINAFFGLDALQLISLSEKARQHDPKHRIERDGIDEHGTKFRINPDITNAQVAVLIASFYAKRQRNVARTSNLMKILLDEEY